MIYRLAKVEDATFLAKMRWDFRRADRPGEAVLPENEFLTFCTEFMEHGIVSGDWAFWIAEEEDEIVSHICILIVSKLPQLDRLHIKRGFLHNVYTRPEYRNRGIGSELMRHVLDWARLSGIGDIALWPSDRSVPFYERSGFSSDQKVMKLTLDANLS